jgi:rod shape-determining protein MreC
MEFLLNRFRNLTVLVIVIAGQLLLLAYQVKTGSDMRLIRVWAVTAITPLARVIESVRSGTAGFFSDYFVLLDVRDQNQRLKSELGRIKLENQFLKTELSTADRARALAQFETRSESKTIAARIIGNGTGANSKVVFIDRGTTSGVQRGMAVITPDGIVGKVVEAFPMASQVLLITDPTFAAGVVSQKNHVHGTLKGTGGPNCRVDYVQNEEKLDVGEWFYTSGDDRVFPKGLPVGQAAVVRPGPEVKEIYVTPSGFKNGFEEVLVVLEGVHQPIPESSAANQPIHMQSPPPPPEGTADSDHIPPDSQPILSTDADRLMERYKKIGAAENHQYGYGTPGSTPPNFNIDLSTVKTPAPAAGTPGGSLQPAATPKTEAPKAAAPVSAPPAGTAPGHQAPPAH